MLGILTLHLSHTPSHSTGLSAKGHLFLVLRALAQNREFRSDFFVERQGPGSRTSH